MMKQFKKVLSILCAIALLVSGMTFALAEEPAEQPVVQEPAVEEPVVEEPVVEEPVVEEPVVEEPMVEEPVVEEPVVEEPVVEEPVVEEPVVEEPVVEEPVVEEPVVEEPVVEEPVVEEPVVEEPVVEEPVVEEPVVEEPVVEEPVVEEPKAEEPASEEPVAEEPQADEPAAEETKDEESKEEESKDEESKDEEPAAEESKDEESEEEEPASEEKEEAPAEEEADEEEAPAEEEASDDTEDEDEDGEDDEEDDGLVPLEDNGGYVDQEVIEENTPAITDEFKGLRDAELFVGQVLTDYLRFGDELTVTLRGCDASTIELQLYVPVNASINTKVDGKAVSFTPADCDDPSLNLFTYELTNAAGHTHEIVLNAYDDVPFQLAAVVKQVEETVEETTALEDETPASEEINETPAEGTVNDTPADDAQTELPEETPAPTVQVSVKTYDVLKVGYSISDSLVAGQRAKIQVKCGKNPYVTLTLNANPDDVTVTIDGEAAEFTAAGNGTYTCDLDEVAFRKFAVVVLAKQDLDFTLSASAREVEEDIVEEEAEETEEESEDIINKEETAEEVTEEPAAETEETAEAIEETEATEETTEETEAAEEGEAAEGAEENTEEATEETEEETEEEAVEAEPLTEEQLIELGYRKVQILNKNGADIYAAIDAEVIGHADFESELWIKDAEAEGWAEIYTEKDPEAEEEIKQFIKLAEIEKQPLTDEEIEALGYRKVQILNQNGTDIYDSTEEEAAVIGHVDFESELWIKDLEVEGWAEIFSEEGAQQFVKLAEIIKQMPSDEEMIEAGYIKVFVAYDIGAKIYDDPIAAKEGEEEEEPVDHLDAGEELWVKLIEGADRAQVFNLDEDAPAQYINLVDIIAVLKPEGMEELPTREIVIHSSLEGLEVVVAGTTVTYEAELINFLEDDNYLIQWKYSVDGEEFIDIEDANELTYAYSITKENADYTWRISIILVTAEE